MNIMLFKRKKQPLQVINPDAELPKYYEVYKNVGH